MGVIGNAINAVTGNESTSLDTFLSKFTDSSQRFIDVIDPSTTFDVKFEFYPIDESKDASNWKGRLLDFGKSLGKKLVSNLTMGLLDLTGGGEVMEEHDTNFPEESNGDKSIMAYLLKGNSLVDSDYDSLKPLTLSMGPYVQEVTIPHVAVDDQGKTTTLLGEFPVNGTFVKPDTNQLIMQIVNTKAALHERIFYPWMREVTLPYWSYQSQPYTTATITVDFSKHNDAKYMFFGCRPNQIHSLQGKQDVSGADNITRQVTFIFDFMTITTNSLMNENKLYAKEKLINKLLGSLGSIASSAGNMVGLS